MENEQIYTDNPMLPIGTVVDQNQQHGSHEVKIDESNDQVVDVGLDSSKIDNTDKSSVDSRSSSTGSRKRTKPNDVDSAQHGNNKKIKIDETTLAGVRKMLKDLPNPTYVLKSMKEAQSSVNEYNFKRVKYIPRNCKRTIWSFRFSNLVAVCDYYPVEVNEEINRKKNTNRKQLTGKLFDKYSNSKLAHHLATECCKGDGVYIFEIMTQLGGLSHASGDLKYVVTDILVENNKQLYSSQTYAERLSILHKFYSSIKGVNDADITLETAEDIISNQSDCAKRDFYVRDLDSIVSREIDILVDRKANRLICLAKCLMKVNKTMRNVYIFKCFGNDMQSQHFCYEEDMKSIEIHNLKTTKHQSPDVILTDTQTDVEVFQERVLVKVLNPANVTVFEENGVNYIYTGAVAVTGIYESKLENELYNNMISSKHIDNFLNFVDFQCLMYPFKLLSLRLQLINIALYVEDDKFEKQASLLLGLMQAE